MAFEAFITRTQDGTDVDFDHNFEREPVIQIARALHNQLSQSQKYYALLANIELPTDNSGNTRQIDAILVSEDGMAVIDFKSATEPFTPSLDDRPWAYTNGKRMKAGSNKNPFRQLEKQRETLYTFMQKLPDYTGNYDINKRFLDHATRKLKSKKSNKHFYHFDILGRVVLTGQRFELPHFKRERTQHWFDIIWQEDCPSLAKSMAFNKGVRLTRPVIATMITEMFGLSRWIELEALYQKPFGFLTGDFLPLPVPVINSSIKLGRSSRSIVPINSEKKHVSREHATLRQTPQGPLILDLGSRNGTWVNGNRLSENQPHLLQHNDLVTLGRLSAGIASDQSVQFRYITRLDTLNDLNLPEMEDTIGMTAINDIQIDD